MIRFVTLGTNDPKKSSSFYDEVLKIINIFRVDGDAERMKELICYGIMVSTAAGSTAYNLSAHGSIIPLDSNLLALTPINAFRPRGWRGALLSEKTKISFNIIDAKKRASSVTADHNEFRDIQEVEIASSNKFSCQILFDNNHSMEERILKEQFFA